jgi:predicted metal-dependent HD superfamily phosphohydrolase
MEAELRASWVLDVGAGPAPDAVLDELLTRHREAHRHYHTLTHVAHVLRTVGELTAEVAVDDPVAVRLAVWFHDAIYEPRSATNEADSAALAARLLPAAGVGARQVDAVARLVMVTAHHEPSADDEAVLIDADLGVLAAEPNGYDAYVHQVRAEYAHLDDSAWRQGRAAVLRRLLDRPRLFHTAPMAAHEHRARANLTAELHGLHGAGPSG